MTSEDLASLYDAHADAVYGFLVSTTRSTADASDLLQEVFLKIGRSVASVASLDNPRAYLLRSAYRAAIDASRRRKTRSRHESSAANTAPTFAPEPTPDRDAFREAMESALAQLPDDQRAVVHLKLWGELTFAEIATTLDVPPNTAASRYRYGIDKMRELLRPLYNEIQ